MRHALLPRPPLHGCVYGAGSEALRLKRHSPPTVTLGKALGVAVRLVFFGSFFSRDAAVITVSTDSVTMPE